MTQASLQWIPMTTFVGQNHPNDGDSIFLLLTCDVNGKYIKLLGMFNTVTTRWVDPNTGVPLVNQNIISWFPTPGTPYYN